MPIDPRIIDHTNLGLNATEKDIENLCKEAKEYGFGAVCVRLNHIAIPKIF